MTDKVIPAMRAAGISEEHITQMSVTNAKRIFDEAHPY